MGWVALGCGVLAMVTGLLPWHAGLAVAQRVWPVLLFLAAIKIVADLCDDAGLFDVAAHLAARVARGRRMVLFLMFVALATVCTWVLSLDTTAVLLTPIGLAVAAELGISPLPFAFASIWLANAASLLLPVSNLTNLLAQDRLGLATVDFMALTWRPQLAILVVVTGVLVLRYRRPLSGRYVVPLQLPARDPVPLGVAAAVALLTGPAIIAGAPAWSVASVGAAALVAVFAWRDASRVTPVRLWQLTPVSMIAFASGLFLVVEAVVRHAHTLLTQVLGTADDGVVSLLRLAGVSAVAANVVNNLPAYLGIEPFAADPRRLVAVLIAVNAGPMIITWGSLANLLWGQICADRGVVVSARRFAAEGLLVVPLALLVGVLALAWP